MPPVDSKGRVLKPFSRGGVVDRLWAPWRMEYIRSDANDGCFICAAAESDDERDALVVARSELSIALLNKFPYNNGHFLAAPYRHEGALEALTDEEMLDLMRMIVQGKRALESICGPHGFNVGINLGQTAGAGLASHLHVHVVPRWSGDTNFMTSIGSAKVIPQALDEMWRQLRDAWNRA
jgi:ATP adenylyltransferase